VRTFAIASLRAIAVIASVTRRVILPPAPWLNLPVIAPTAATDASRGRRGVTLKLAELGWKRHALAVLHLSIVREARGLV